MAQRAVVLLSGGLDSTTAAALARREGWNLYGLTVRYGQRHACELEAARRVAQWLGLAEHREIAIDLAAFGGSSLVGDGEIPPAAVGAAHASGVPNTDASRIPSTYVPARNTVLLSLALAYAEVTGATRIVIGVNALDYSGYPDCRPEFIAAFDYLASLATRAGVSGQPTRVWAPLQHLTKAGIVRLGLELKVDFGSTHSCYDPGPAGHACGQCDSCHLRARGFEEAGVTDPLVQGTGRAETGSTKPRE
jgi:7-cyano-7-deazaguanine synthase